MNYRNFIYAIVMAACCICALPGCDAFNISVPQYIEKYIYSAAAESITGIAPQYIHVRSDGAWIIPPGSPCDITLQLRNAKRYILNPVLYTWDGTDWTPVGTSVNGVIVTSSFTAPDTVHISLATPSLGQEFRFRLVMQATDSTGREFSDQPFDLPLLKFNQFPPALNITGIAPGFSGGLDISWTQDTAGDIGDAERLVISCDQAGIAPQVFGRVSPGSSSWTGVSGTGSAADPYKATIFSGKAMINAAVAVKAYNIDGVAASASVLYDSGALPYALYVVPGGTGIRDGSSWANAMGDPQAAIEAAAASGGGRTHVLIKEGSYYPGSRPNGWGVSERDNHFSLRDGVTVIGGFRGTEKVIVPLGDATKTIFSGDLAKNDIPGDMSVNRDDNVYHVFYHPLGVLLGNTASLQNVTVRGGNALSGTSFDAGGGMHNDNCDPELKNCIFLDNAARLGGAVYGFAGTQRIDRSTFAGNYASEDGGALHSNGSNVILNDCVFSGNTADNYGGAIMNAGGGTVITACTFSGNSALNNGGAVMNDGGGTVTTACTFSENDSNDGGGVYNKSISNSFFIACTFENNEVSTAGGGMSNSECDPGILLCTFSGNGAGSEGGGIYNISSNPILRNCTIAGNFTVSDTGCGIYNNASSPKIFGTIIAGNFRNGSPDAHDAVGGNAIHASSADNYIDDGADVSGVFRDTAAGRAVLKNNGGSIRTLMLKTGNTNTYLPVIPDWWPAGITVPVVDQRGYNRHPGKFYLGAVDPEGTEP